MPLCPRCKKPLPAGARACPTCSKPRPSRSPSSTPDGATVLLADSGGKAAGAVAATSAGMRFGPYEIVREIARGAMGMVYKARDTKLDRMVALKVLISGEFAGQAEVARFQREAQAAAKLRHPNIVPIYDVGEFGGRHYFTMEFVEGASLHQVFATKQTPTEQAVRLLAQVADAMEHAHKHGVIHRDLKPANILVDGDGNVRVTDFGLSKAVHGSQLTESGTTLGTPSYMPPEQARGHLKEVDEQSDVYALGAILYEALTGVPPFLGENNVDTILRVVKEDPVPPRRLQPTVPPDLEAVCLKALEKEKSRRYASAKEFGDDLRRFLAKEPVLARPASFAYRLRRKVARNAKWVAIAAAVLLVNLIVVAAVANKKRPSSDPSGGGAVEAARDAGLVAAAELRARGLYALARQFYLEVQDAHGTGPVAEEARFAAAECALREAEASQDPVALAEARDLLRAVTDPKWAPAAQERLAECERLIAAVESNSGVGTMPGLTPSDPLHRLIAGVIARGREYLTPERQADLERAKTDALAAKKKSKEALKAVTDYAGCFIVQGEWKKAEEVVLEALSVAPERNEVQVWFLVEFCRFQREDFRGVEAAARSMASASPKHFFEKVRRGLGTSREDRRKFRDMIEQMRSSQDPSKVLENNPMVHDAQELVDAVAMAPYMQYGQILHMLALAYEGKADEAVRMADATIERGKGSSDVEARTRFVRAQAMRIGGDLQGAKKAFEEIAKKTSDWPGFEAFVKVIETMILSGEASKVAQDERTAMERFQLSAQRQRLALWFGLARAVDGHKDRAKEIWAEGLKTPSLDLATRVALRLALGEEPPAEEVAQSQISLAERKFWKAVGAAAQGNDEQARRLAAAAAEDAVGKEPPYEIAKYLADRK